MMNEGPTVSDSQQDKFSASWREFGGKSVEGIRVRLEHERD